MLILIHELGGDNFLKYKFVVNPLLIMAVQSNRHVRDLFFKCDDLRCWFSRVLFERDIYATFMHLFVLCLYINPDILLSRHIKVKYIFIFAFTSKTLFIIAQ